MGPLSENIIASFSQIQAVEETLLRSFYKGEISLDSNDYNNEDEYHNMMVSLTSLLCSKSSSEVIDILKKYHSHKDVTSSDIPQYSDLSIALYATPEKLNVPGRENLSYEEMGKLLWPTARAQGADMKYGENHAKTAALIGLVSVSKGKINLSSFGRYFLSLNPVQQATLIPMLWLRVPLFQNYFLGNNHEEVLKKDISILSVSTQKRRLSNVRTIIEIIKKGYYLREDNSPSDDIDDILDSTLVINEPLQVIYYGAPGTGKSFAIDNMADDDRTVRTTFHPDSDYASFVGAYKPTMEDVPINSIYGESVQFATGKNGHPGTERKIVYKYVPQAFLKAYVEAWKDLDNPHYLVIEEINRGNCAQIFGDLFQLLDRNAMGCSSYAIHADDDIRQFLASDEKGFGKLSEEQKEAIRSFVLVKDNGSQKQIGEQILNGEQLLLPPNLYIWATMNTSDQSLFPIDSAFKRRWNWKFVPINYEQKNWLLHIGDSYYRWGDFLKQINPIIFSLTESSDKQMGYFFAKPDEKIGQNVNENNTISEDIFLNKVLFYIWTDILKDFDAGKEPFINPETGRAYEFSDFFDNKKNRVVEFITKSQFGLEEVDVDDEPSNAEEEERQSKRSKYSSLTVSFLDGSVIKEETIVATYLKAIEKIGIEKAAEVAASLKYKRRGHALITKEPVQELLDNNYTYATIGGFSVLKGIKTKSLVLLLRQINDVCNLGLNITLE